MQKKFYIVLVFALLIGCAKTQISIDKPVKQANLLLNHKHLLAKDKNKELGENPLTPEGRTVINMELYAVDDIIQNSRDEGIGSPPYSQCKAQFSVEDLVELIKQIIEPPSGWTDPHSIFPQGSILVVTTDNLTHRKISKLLSELRNAKETDNSATLLTTYYDYKYEERTRVSLAKGLLESATVPSVEELLDKV